MYFCFSYYDQLCALEGKVPFPETQIPFKWKDAFDKGSFFIARMSLSMEKIIFYINQVLYYNILMCVFPLP